ncbi:MAG: NADH-quinone oxidoreductase subunit NuoE [Coriobacteriales bacterium]|jgi:NADH-quinone oxidoreductase subunit E|nr:NADH-quinone oxidoreductase subunit NuoE [Coriobacteriales bacterium]
MAQEAQVDLGLIEPTLDKYADTPGSLIAILQETQGIYGYLPMPAMELIAERTGTPIASIIGVATFYAQFRLQPVGKHLIMLCQGTACHVNGSELIARAISDELGIEDGQTTDDGLFTIEHVACLGCCSLSPVMMINGQAYGSLTPDKAKKILRQLAAEGSETA